MLFVNQIKKISNVGSKNDDDDDHHHKFVVLEEREKNIYSFIHKTIYMSTHKRCRPGPTIGIIVKLTWMEDK